MSTTKQNHLIAKLVNASAFVITNKGKQKSQINGELLFSISNDKETPKLTLDEANLIASTVEAKEGDSGQISLNLRNPSVAKYSPDGTFEVSFQMNLHYPLIDKSKGYRKSEGKDLDYFVPFVDTIMGKIQGKFGEKLSFPMREPTKEMRVPITLSLDLKAQEFPWVTQIVVQNVSIVGTVIIAFAFFKTLPIQPVFIRSGPTDASPTGWSFDTLMQAAKCMWRKCCIFFNVLPPVYVNKANYKVLDTATEIDNLRNEVTQSNAIEVFVADSMNQYFYANWGGGATFGSGTANAQIVTCDAQLRVPDPNNPGAYLGAININHLAHELGHVMGLQHPGVPTYPPMTGTGTANTVMEPSGFYKDNPHAQSGNNCTHLGNPLFSYTLMPWASRCISNPEIP